MRGPAVKTIVIAAGGTGGHFFPAEALAAELIRRGHRIVLMTDSRSGALKSAVFAGHESHVLQGAGIAGRGVTKAVRAIFALLAGTFHAYRILRKLDAAVLVGFGGYPSVAPLVASALLRRRPKRVLHEQNAVLGRANRFLARFADIFALGFEHTQLLPADKPTRFVGNPVRPALAALHGTPYTPPTGTIEVLVLGGSLGARIFSDIVPGALAALPEQFRARLHVVQQCRKEDVARVSSAYAASGITADLAPFFDDVAARYAASHLVISRAGASSCAEIAVIGRPAILVPLPGAIDDHQMANAASLAEAGAAIVLRQPDFTIKGLAQILTAQFSDAGLLAREAAAAAAIGRPHAAADLADMLEALMTGSEAVS
jgi:UDP-N-acetylglucosamine--N-acetylmuramyl-(pentapeptide) pyrophosphoryl-undecaprenol N-acetylglucosamine transferase